MLGDRYHGVSLDKGCTKKFDAINGYLHVPALNDISCV